MQAEARYDLLASSLDTISIGDALKALSSHIYGELQQLLIHMHTQDPEWRTVALRRFVALSRARIAQMLAVVRWVDMTGAALTLKAVAGEKTIEPLLIASYSSNDRSPLSSTLVTTRQSSTTAWARWR